MKIKNKLLLVFFIVCLLVSFSCKQPKPEWLELFLVEPDLNVFPANNGLVFSIRDSFPSADSYNVYWKQGIINAKELKVSGTKITGESIHGVIKGLTDGEIYSVLVTAVKDEYEDIDSDVATGIPGKKKSTKRGVSYNFNFPRPNNSDSGSGHNNSLIAARDMELLGKGTTWFYDWSTNLNSTIGPLAAQYNLSFMPMIWGAGRGADAFNNYLNGGQLNALNRVRDYVNANPGIKYLLAYNEPNFVEEANMTPTQAAQVWPALVTRARELNLKIISPAMNYGTMPPYGNPTLWLEEFFGTDGHPGFDNVSLDEIEGVAIHLYNDYGNNVRTFIDRFRKFEKPIWMTEWCAWADRSGVYLNSAQWQIDFLSQSGIYMELDPAVARYAWFIPKGGRFDSELGFPYNKLLTAPPTPGLSELTALGIVFVNMSTLDSALHYITGEVIPAKDFSNSNLSELAPSASAPYVINHKGWEDGVRFRPTTDTGENASILDIVFFAAGNNPNNMWVEYQVAVKETRDYTLSLRYNASQDMNFQITVNRLSPQNITIEQSAGWAVYTNTLNLPAGKHTIRIRKTTSSGECAINWLKVE